MTSGTASGITSTCPALITRTTRVVTNTIGTAANNAASARGLRLDSRAKSTECNWCDETSNRSKNRKLLHGNSPDLKTSEKKTLTSDPANSSKRRAKPVLYSVEQRDDHQDPCRQQAVPDAHRLRSDNALPTATSRESCLISRTSLERQLA